MINLIYFAGLSIACPGVMVELLKGFPSYVAAYKASGKVNAKEYERVVMTRVDEVANEFGAVNFLVRLETDMENYSLRALVDYLKISFKHIHRWNRMAIVSDERKVRYLYDALSPLVRGKVIGFKLKDFKKAKAWVSEPDLTDENAFLWNWKAILTDGMKAGFIATSAMTAFSYLFSKIKKSNFSEPNLLGSLIEGWNPELTPSISKMVGWQIHYALGLGWATTYAPFKKTRHPVAASLLYGSLGGVLAIYTWKILFDLGSKVPKTDFKNFYRQLFLSHLLFSLTAQEAYSIL